MLLYLWDITAESNLQILRQDFLMFSSVYVTVLEPSN